jgi:hypothetical protein
MWMFQTTDYEGTPVSLSNATWQTKAGNGEPGSHPEIQDYLADIQVTIEQPDRSSRGLWKTRSRMFYRLQVGHGLFRSKHLVVIVKYVAEELGWLC